MILSDLSIKRPVFMSMVLLALILFGTIAYKRIGIDLYPKVDFPVITVVSVLPGSDPETVESKVTDPLEETLSTVNSIKNLRSTSSDNVSVIIIEFDLEKDINVAYQEVQEKVAAARSSLPKDLLHSVVGKFDIDAAPILSIIISGDLPVSKLTHIANKEIKQALKRIPNVGQIHTIGGREKNIWLSVDRNRMDAYGLSLAEVEQAVISNHLDLPAGRLSEGVTELNLKTKGELTSLEDFENIIVANRQGTPITFADIGTVEEGLEDLRSMARYNQTSAIALLVGRQSGANTVEVANSLKHVVAKLQAELESRGIHLQVAQDNSVFIERSVDDVRFDLLFGGGLAVLIVLLFLRNVRSSFVCALALPAAVISTFAFMAAMDFTQNMMTLLALSIAIGLLIDDAIVVQENIMRYIEDGSAPKRAASLATKEIALAVFATTMTVVAVFVPVAFMEGIVGRFFYQFGLTVSFAVLISMFISFTLNPMFSARLLKQPKKGRLYRSSERIFQGIERGYTGLLRFSLCHKGLVITLAIVTFVGTIFIARSLRFEFVPSEDQSQFAITIKTPQGSSLDYTKEKVLIAESLLHEHSWIDYVFTTVGSDSMQSVNQASIFVKMCDKEARTTSQDEAMILMREALTTLSDCTVSVEMWQGISDGRGRMSDIQFEVRGPSLDKLMAISKEVIAKMAGAKGYLDVDTSFETGKPGMEVVLNRSKAADLGVSPALVASTLKTAFGGKDITTFKQGGDRYDVTLRYAPKQRESAHQVEWVSVKNGSGALVPLSQLVSLEKRDGPTQIDRYNRQRQITVYANLNREEKVLGEAMQEISSFINEVDLPDGYQIAFAGAAEDFKESFGHLVFALLLAVVLVYMVLAAQFESFIHPFIIMLSLPLSIVGAIGALVLFKMTMSIFTMIGVIMLMGLVTKNAILLIEFINSLTRGEEKMARFDAILKAGRYRLRPILMTTLSTVFGMLPVAIGNGDGAESRAPMAMAVIGGLLTSTLLTLVIIPVIYSIIEDFRDKRRFSWTGIKKILQRKQKKTRPADAVGVDKS